MKKILKALFLVSVLPLLFASCADEEGLNSTAMPVVKYIRSTDPAQSESYLTSASMGDVIAIIGNGLEGVRSVRFNDVEAKLNPTNITSNAIVVTVPSDLPTEVTHTITLTTQKGRSCTVEGFVTKAPAPKIVAASIEWPRPGEVFSIEGDCFFANLDGSHPEVVIGGLTAEVVSCDNRRIEVRVPAEIDRSMPQRILVTNDYGTGRSSFYLYDDSAVFIDFENLSWDWWGYSGKHVFSDDGVSGQYMSLHGTSKAWNWNTDGLALYYCNLLEDGSVLTELFPEGEEPGDWSLKFEIRVKAWSDLYMSLWFTNVYNTFSVDGTEAQCHWKGYEDETLRDGAWHTVTIPLSSFNTDKEGKASRKLMAGEIRNFCIFFFGGLENDANADAPLELHVDNFRLVKNK